MAVYARLRLLGVCQLATILSAFTVHPLWADEIEAFTEPYRDLDLAASEMGCVVEILVKEGDRVHTGQVLARLDDDVLRASLDIARAGMESAGRLDAALAELQMQAEMLAKLEELHTRDHASQREVERCRAQKEIAEARVRSVQEETDVKVLEHQRILKQLDQRQIVSPIDGIVTRLNKDLGEFVSPADAVVVKIVQLDPLLVVFSVPSKEAGQLQPGQTVSVQIGGVPSPTNGTIEFISPTADPQSGTTRVRVRIPNDGEQLPSGATCRLLLPGSTSRPPANRSASVK